MRIFRGYSVLGWSCAAFAAAGGGTIAFMQAFAQEGPDWNKGLPRQHKSKYLVSDSNRPLPPVVKPGAKPGDPPADAVILFDGRDLSRWRKASNETDPAKWQPAGWKVENGYTEVNATGSITTREKFGDCQLHIEFMEPFPPKGVSQVRGNSGIFFMSRYELQVLDSYDNKTYADGSSASIYAQHPALYNACRLPGEWQSYDVVFRAPRFEGDKVLEPARMTVFHNGVLVHHNGEVYGETRYRELASYRPHGRVDHLTLQDHGDRQPMRFRNIWIRRLDLTPEPTE